MDQHEQKQWLAHDPHRLLTDIDRQIIGSRWLDTALAMPEEKHIRGTDYEHGENGEVSVCAVGLFHVMDWTGIFDFEVDPWELNPASLAEAVFGTVQVGNMVTLNDRTEVTFRELAELHKLGAFDAPELVNGSRCMVPDCDSCASSCTTD